MDLGKIAAAFRARLLARIEKDAARSGQVDPERVQAALFASLGITDAAMHRAALAAHTDFGIGSDHDIGILFGVAHAMGDGKALRRARVALTDPRARGREITVLDALIGGASAEDALREPTPVEAAGTVVVPFKRP